MITPNPDVQLRNLNIWLSKWPSPNSINKASGQKETWFPLKNSLVQSEIMNVDVYCIAEFSCNFWALHTGTETDSLDPDSTARELHTTHSLRALHCLTGFHALSHSTACSSDLDLGRVEAKWSLNPDPQSPSAVDPRSHVESPYVDFQQISVEWLCWGLQALAIAVVPIILMSNFHFWQVLFQKWETSKFLDKALV